MPLIPYPDIPNVPGVPSLARLAGLAVIPAPLFATLNAFDLPFLQQPIRWGVFTADGSTQVLAPDSVLTFDYANDTRVSDYPVEQGGFSAYNKVATPFNTRLRMTVGGTEANRSAFISQLDTMLASVDLFSVLTPERVYLNVTLVSYDMRRESREGVSLLTIDTIFREVRVTATTDYSSTQSISAAAPVNRGQVQTVDGGTVDVQMLEVTSTGAEIPVQ